MLADLPPRDLAHLCHLKTTGRPSHLFRTSHNQLLDLLLGHRFSPIKKPPGLGGF
jgi:hypothetical protein